MKGLLFLYIIAIGYANAQNILPPTLPINIAEDEQNPIVSPDGNTLYFTVANHPENEGGKRDKGDIWFSEKVNGEWSSPIHAKNPLNTTGYNTVSGISEDGQRLYLLGQYSLSGRSKIQGIAISEKNNEEWSEPRSMTVPYLKVKSSIFSGYVTPDEKIFIFSIGTKQGTGAEDIYSSRMDVSGEWKEPRSLGVSINTPFQELSPWLSDDTQYLYFASNKQGGHGSFDIYRSERLDDTWTNWSVPVNMGERVNSKSRELFYKTYPGLGMDVYTTTINSEGYGDIQIVNFPKLNLRSVKKTIDTTVRDNNTANSLITIQGKVYEKGTNKAIAARVHFYTKSLFETTAGEDGVFSITIPYVQTYRVRVDAVGYISYFKEMVIPSFSLKAASEVTVELQPIQIGVTINLKNVLFLRGTSNLLEESFEELNMVVDFMTDNPTVNIELAGHTDNRGSHSKNVELSQERADRVKKYLVDKGIENHRISGKGYGGIRPIASNDVESTRRLNRRVEFTIVKN